MVINAKTGSMRYAMTRPRLGGDMMDLRGEMDCLVGSALARKVVGEKIYEL